MLRPLIDRTTLVRALDEAWQGAQSGTPQLVVLRGQRRVGKTFLLSHFAATRETVWHTGNTDAEQLGLARCTESFTGTGRGPGPGVSFDSWRRLLDSMIAAAAEEPLLVVIDEFTDLLVGSPTFGQQLRDAWDRAAMSAQNHLMLVLTGSVVSAVEAELSGEGPLFGRPTLSLEVKPVTLLEAAEFLPGAPAATLIEAYAACGGFPLHLLAWEPQVSTAENLRRLAGTPGGLLVSSAQHQLGHLTSRGVGYERVLRTIGVDRVAHRTLLGRVQADIQHPLGVLQDARVVEREVPAGSSPRESRSSLYRICDPYLRFWFGTCSEELGLIEGGRGEQVLQRRADVWRRHVASVFEDACRDHADRLVGTGALPASGPVGRWWGSPRDPATRRAVEVELDAVGWSGSTLSFAGEAKWGPVDARDAEDLRRRCGLVDRSADPELVLWGGRGLPAIPGVRTFGVEDVLTP